MRRLVALLVLACGLAAPAGAQALTGVVEGTVAPVEWAPEVEVCLVESQPSETCTAPAVDGSYVLRGIPFGEDRIEFVPSLRSRLLRQYYDEVEGLAEAKAVVLTPQSPLAEHVDANLLEGGWIEGTVTATAGGGPLPEVEVCAVSVGSPILKRCAETDASGGYQLHSLRTGPYRVGFWGTGTSAGYEPWSHPVVAVTAGATTAGVDATMSVGARIEGSVTADGAPLAGIPVCLFTVAGSVAESCTEPDGGGFYAFRGLPPGAYQVGFALGEAEIAGTGTTGEVDGFAPQFYEGATVRSEATTISLLTAETAEGVDAALAPPPVAPTPAAPGAAASPIVPPTPVLAAPGPKKKRKPACKKPRRRKKVKGKVRCVRPRHRQRKRRSHKKHVGRTGHRRAGKREARGPSSQTPGRRLPSIGTYLTKSLTSFHGAGVR